MTHAAHASHTLVIRVDGVFDAHAAQELVERLALAEEGDIRIDLTHVREFHDFGVVILARALAARPRTSVLGLRHHHLRLLRYLGMDAGVSSEGSAAELA